MHSNRLKEFLKEEASSKAKLTPLYLAFPFLSFLPFMASTRLLSAFLLLCFLCFASSPVSANKVAVSLYYEALCPYCSSFIVNHLVRIFQNGLISIVDLDLVPYGNARVTSNGSIICQHGENECLLNAIEACAIRVWPDVQRHFNFVRCIEHKTMVQEENEWQSCFQETSLDSGSVLDCYNGGNAKQLEVQYAVQTDSLQPPHQYVPWVVVDGKPLYDDYLNFEAHICRAYKGELPEVCDELTQTISKDLKASRGDQVCLANKSIN